MYTMKLSSTALLLLGSHQGYKQAVVATRPPVNSKVLSIELFGPGFCVDSVGNFFSSAQTRNVGSSAEDCSSWCLQNTDNLIGFSYSSSGQQCFCEFDGGELPSPPPEYTNPPAINLQSLSGTGPIQGTIPSGVQPYECYTYLDSTTPSPTRTITSSPTNAQTAAIELFGPGFCVDSVGNFYSSAQTGNFGSSVEDCGAWCLRNPDKLLGFMYSNSGQRCFCAFDGGEIPSPPPEYPNTFGVSLQSLPGTGPIQGIIPSSIPGQPYDCYTYLDATNSPSSSPPPTAMPTSTVITPPDTCGTCPLVGQKYIPTFGCEVFYSCEDRVLHRCPAGLLFDVDIQLCNFPGTFTCTCAEATILTPTSNPTANPSLSPTVSPSASPSTNPTQTPSLSPSSSPSKSPISVKPTAEPSQSPSASPSTNPTQAPSSSPSSSPLNAPTDSPTHLPTKVPTLSPVFEPEEPRLRSSPPMTVGPTTAPSSQPMTSGPTSSYSAKASKNTKNAKVTDGSSKSSKSNGNSSKSESYSGKSSKSNHSSSGYTSSKSLKENFAKGFSLRY